MPRFTRVLLHSRGPALWPEHRPLNETLRLRDTTPPHIWISKYQGVPTSPHGTIFKKRWWSDKNRYDARDPALLRKAIRRFISWDTAGSTSPTAAYSAAVVLEMQPDWSFLVREVVRDRWGFSDLTPQIEKLARKWYEYDGESKLASVIVEDESTGGPAISTLRAHAPGWLAEALWGFDPEESKELRAHRIATWCQNDCIKLPYPSESVPWLVDFEDELFDFPESAFKDQVDAFSQAIWAVHPYVEQGYWARKTYAEQAEEQRQMLEMERRVQAA